MAKRKTINKELAEEYAGKGLTMADMAALFGVSERTLYTRVKEDEALATAIRRGQVKTHIFVGGKLMEQIEAGNTTAIIFYLKTRCGWSETQKLEVKETEREEVPVGLPAIYEKLRQAYGNKQEAVPKKQKAVKQSCAPTGVTPGR